MLESVLNKINEYLEDCICYEELLTFAISKGYTQEEIDAEIRWQTGV